MPTLTVREALEEEIGLLADIELEGPIRWGFEGLKGAFLNKNVIMVAEYDASVIGFIVGILAGVELQIANVVVLRDSRRRGAATALMRALSSAALRRGAVECFLEVAVGNVAARALYGRLGFRAIGVRRRYYSSGEDALMMKAGVRALAQAMT